MEDMMGADWQFEREYNGVLRQEHDRIVAKLKADLEKLKRHIDFDEVVVYEKMDYLRSENKFMESLLNVEQRRRLRRWRNGEE